MMTTKTKTQVEQEAIAKAEVAMMGCVVKVREDEHYKDEVYAILKHIESVLDNTGVVPRKTSRQCHFTEDFFEDPCNDDFGNTTLSKVINPDNLYKVYGVVVNTLADMILVALLLKNDNEDEPEDSEYYIPKPFAEDYGTGYPASYCYVLNMSQPQCSEFGDCFFEKRGGKYYRKF